MIHYHGLPITPETAAIAAVECGHAFVSFRHPSQLSMAIGVCQSVAYDNGAFSAWRSGVPILDWTPYYEWVQAHRVPSLDFAVIPDVIDGDEDDNDRLLAQWPFGSLGAPVWHMHESLDRLGRLVSEWPRVCIGSSGAFARVGAPQWWARMDAALQAASDAHGRPKTRLHGLRMLDSRIVARLPLASADSTNIARNIGIDAAWRGTYAPTTKEARARVLRERIEAQQAPAVWRSRNQPSLFDEVQA